MNKISETIDMSKERLDAQTVKQQMDQYFTCMMKLGTSEEEAVQLTKMFGQDLTKKQEVLKTI